MAQRKKTAARGRLQPKSRFVGAVVSIASTSRPNSWYERVKTMVPSAADRTPRLRLAESSPVLRQLMITILALTTMICITQGASLANGLNHIDRLNSKEADPAPPTSVETSDDEPTSPTTLPPPLLLLPAPSSTSYSSTPNSDSSDKDAFLKLLNIQMPTKPPPPGGASEQPQHPHRSAVWSNSVQVLVSKESWSSYTKFNEETCRSNDDAYIADQLLNNTDNGYFSWEERMFHQELRKIILPETRDGSYTSLIGSPLLKQLDSRIFASPPQSLCKAKSSKMGEDETDKEKEEFHSFEDFLINKVLSWALDFPRNPKVVSNNPTRQQNVSFLVAATGKPDTAPTGVTSSVTEDAPQADKDLLLAVAK